MLRVNRALLISVTATAFIWVGAAAATGWITFNPDLLPRPVVVMLWIHSMAVAATIVTVSLFLLRALCHQVTESKQVYALGLEHGVELADSIHH